MYRSFAYLIVFVLLLPLAAQASSRELEQLRMDIPCGELTLAEAKRLALQDSPSIAAALERIKSAAAVVDQARSSLMPQVGMTAAHRWQDSTVQLDWSPTTRVNDSFKLSTVSLEANWLLFDGFARKAQILTAKYGKEAAEAGLEESRRLLTDAVVSAFYQAQIASETMLIAKNNQEFNRMLEGDADKRWQVGTIPEAEKLNFSVRALQAESDYLSAAQSFEVVSTVLAQLLALPDGELPPQLCPVAAERDPSFQAIPDLSVEEAYALENRSDLKLLRAQLAAAQQQKKVSQASYAPKLLLNSGLSYSYYDDLGTTDQEEHDSYIGFSLAWDLYSGGAKAAQVREADHEVMNLRHQIDGKVLEVRSEINQAGVRARKSWEMYQRHHRALEMTLKIRDHIEKSYRAGVTTLTRLNEAQRDLVQMAGQAIYSRINYQLALQDLDTASGRIVEVVD